MANSAMTDPDAGADRWVAELMDVAHARAVEAGSPDPLAERTLLTMAARILIEGWVSTGAAAEAAERIRARQADPRAARAAAKRAAKAAEAAARADYEALRAHFMERTLALSRERDAAARPSNVIPFPARGGGPG